MQFRMLCLVHVSQLRWSKEPHRILLVALHFEIMQIYFYY
jgi:hypothetical protein